MSENVKFVDVDKSWDGKGSLDEHRQKAFATLEQVPFGTPVKPKPLVPSTETVIADDATESDA